MSSSSYHSPDSLSTVPKMGIVETIRSQFIILCTVACIAGAISWVASSAVCVAVVSKDLDDFWFNADCPQVYAQMTSFTSKEHGRVRRHPFFSLITTPIIVGLGSRLPLTHDTLIRGYLAICSAFSGVLIYLVCFRIVKSSVAAIVWTCLFLTSSSFVFWCCVPDTHCFASPTMIFPLVVLGYSNALQPKQYLFTLSTLISLAVTATNAMSGVVCTLLGLSPKSAIESLKSVVCFSVFLVVLQITIINPTKTGIFFINNPQSEMQWVDKPDTVGLISKSRAILIVGAVMPQVETWDNIPKASRHSAIPDVYPHAGVDVQASPFTNVGKVAVVVWLMLLSLSVYAGLTHLAHRDKLFIAITSVALIQLLFHSVYGPVTFIYSANYGPMFLLFSIYSYTTRFKHLALWSAVGLICLQAYNNGSQFLLCVDILKQIGVSSGGA